jgi:signal peptidase I
MSVLIPATVLLAVLIKTFLGQIFYVPSGSMAPTINGAESGGDRVVVNKLTSHMGHKPQRGEIIVFRDELGWLESDNGLEGGGGGDDDNPGVSAVKKTLTFVGLLPSNDEKDLIKRVIGIGGDEVSCFQNRIFVNGTRLVEPYVFPGDQPCRQQFNVLVPPGRLFVMGDHREASADSTFHLRDRGQGTIAESSVIGPAYGIVLPFDRAQRFELPDIFAQ